MKFDVYRPAVACLSRSALSNNINAIQKLISKRAILHRSEAQIMAMIKANAYGHDVEVVLPELFKLGIRQFAVASIEEGIQARKLSSRAEILVLGGTLQLNSNYLNQLRKYRLDLGINDLPSLKLLSKNQDIRVHLKLDTGMSRLGIKPDQWHDVLALIQKSRMKLHGLFTHYATSQDIIFHRQAMLFEEAVRWFWNSGVRPHWVHSENSAALIGKNSLKRGILSEVGNLVRPGISMYGYYPRRVQPTSVLKPVLELISEVGLVKTVEQGEGISYGHLYIAPRKHDYGIVTLGYADGLSKLYAPYILPQIRDARGRVKGALKVCGAICMDMVMVRAAKREVLKAGDQVVFWGRFPNQVLAEGLVEPYELNLRISKRIPRVWVA